ncbi:MAG: D-sedoheptulose 7-phosphate isomerase [Bacteroidales bacterium]|nr:D-sedoheptulose 7-phosphate isomerase [Bacteroidales bacterium]MBQ7490849.1 D-sedoheptulose 7-phosphate isomerase [Bacteroidales bacterium]
MNSVQQIINESIDVKTAVMGDASFIRNIEKVAEICTMALKAGSKVLFCGNGGSAADAQHIASELSGRFYIDRRPFAAEALHCNTSYLTAVANDYGFDCVYSRLLQATAKKGDVLVGLSTSGNSQNVVNAFEMAKTLGLSTVAMTGAGGGKLKPMADVLLAVPSDNTPRIQECHILLGHIICELVEKNMLNY